MREQRYFAYLEEGKPLLLLDLDPQKPRSRRRTLVTGAVVSALMLGTTVATTLPAQSAPLPTKVLQSVAIDLGTDGTIHGVASDNVRRTKGETSSDRTDLDPQKVAGQLPVRVLTSYRLGDRTGTDLADLKGKKGRVEVTVTVQNATVRPQLLTYDAGAVKRSRYALVGIPLTVTAAATLPKGAFAEVVRPAAGVPGTNGVIGQDDDGRTTVQWAALLAPPQLSSSAAFTLVQDAADFRLPELHLSVQTGLATDTSLQRLLQRAFDKDASGSTLSLQVQTIETVRNVSRTLGTASSTLAQITTALNAGADTLGDELIDRLIGSADQVLGDADSLELQLTGLTSQLTNGLDDSNRKAVEGLTSALESVRAFLGDPSAPAPKPPVLTGTGCTLASTGGDAPDSLYAQVVRVSQQLALLKTGTDGCRQVIADDLRSSLGDVATCSPGSKALACSLVGVRDQLTGVATFVSTKGNQVLTQFKPSAVVEVRNAVSTLTKAVAGLQTTAGILGTGTTTDTLDADLRALGARIQDVLDQLSDTSAGALSASLKDINTTAKARMAELGGATGDPGSVAGQARALADAICAYPDVAPLKGDPLGDPVYVAVGDYVASLRALATGTDCAGAPIALPAPYATGLVSRIDADYLAWAALADLTSPTGTKGTGSALQKVTTGLTALKVAVTDVSTTLDGPSAGSLGSKVTALRAKVDALYVAPTPGGDCPGVLDPKAPPLNALADAFSVLDCSQKGLDKNLGELLASAAPTYSAAAAAVEDAASKASKAREQADASLADLIRGLTDQLDAASTQTQQQATTSVTGLRKDIATRGTQITTDLDGRTKTAVDDIETQLTRSNTDVQTSFLELSGSLDKVQLDLGDLLDVVRSNAGRSNNGKSQVESAVDTASRFGRVRGTEVDEIALQDRQFRAAMEREAAQGPFGLDLPAGSTSVAVFSFHLRAI